MDILARLFIVAVLTLACSVADAAVSVKSFGAKADGKANDAPAIQKALDSLAEAGGEVTLPAGRYRMDGGVKVPPGVTLAGTWQAPHHAEHRKGTILLAYGGKNDDTAPALIYLSPNSAVRGVTIFYPEQKVPEPYTYPWSIEGEGMHCSVMDVTLVNSYKGIAFEKPHELHYIRNVFGCPLKIGISIDRCTDIGRIENVHFNPHYWARSGEEGLPEWPALLDYLFKNCVSFQVARSDWEFITNTFSFGCKVGYRFYGSEAGACNGNFLGIAADWSEICVLVEQTQPAGLLITNGEFVGGRGSTSMLDVRPTHSGVVQLANCAFWGPAELGATIDGPGYTSLSQCNFVNWDVSGKGYPCVQVNAGQASITNNFFREGKKQISLATPVKSAVITGNTFSAPENIDNKSAGTVSITGNVGPKP